MELRSRPLVHFQPLKHPQSTRNPRSSPHPASHSSRESGMGKVERAAGSALPSSCAARGAEPQAPPQGAAGTHLTPVLVPGFRGARHRGMVCTQPRSLAGIEPGKGTACSSRGDSPRGLSPEVKPGEGGR